MTHQVRRFGALLLTAGLLTAGPLVTSCSDPERTSTEFCMKLSQATGPTGIESALEPGNPDRVDGVVSELVELHDRAPEEISATTRTLLNFFQEYQRAARDERRDVIAASETEIQLASLTLNDYALEECGLLLGRVAPTPLPTANPRIDTPTD